MLPSPQEESVGPLKMELNSTIRWPRAFWPEAAHIGCDEFFVGIFFVGRWVLIVRHRSRTMWACPGLKQCVAKDMTRDGVQVRA